MSNVPDRYAEVERYARQASEKSKFPIHNFQQLETAFGGTDAELQYRGKGQKLGQLRRELPEGFFPIESEQDFIAKVSYLENRSDPRSGGHTPGEQRDRAPEDAGEPPFQKAEEKRPGGVPAIRGHGRKEWK